MHYQAGRQSSENQILTSTVQAESLAAAVQAICRLIDAGVPLSPRAASGPEYLAWMKRRNDALAIRRAPVLKWAFPAEGGDDASDLSPMS
jgi:hypothetical protein